MRLFDYVAGQKRRLIYPQMGALGLKLTGYKMYDVYRSPQKQLEVAKVLDDSFDLDFVYPLDYGVIFVETLGLPLLKPDYDFPSTLDNPVKSHEILSAMKLPDPYSDGNMPVYLESISLLAENFSKPLAVALVGPFTLAVELAGATDICRSIIKDPVFVTELLGFTTAMVRDYALAVEKAGAKLIQLSEPSAVMLSPARFENLVQQKIQDVFDDLNAFKVLHICGDTSLILDRMFDCHAEGLSLDQIMSLGRLAPGVPDHIVIIGNIDPVTVMADLPAEAVRTEARRILRSMDAYPNFMFSFGCDCLINTPTENVKVCVEEVHQSLIHCDLV